MKRALVVGCGKIKVWDKHPELGPVAARNAYVGPLFGACREYADVFYMGNWFVLSAKYGLIHPDTPIQDYDVTLKHKDGCIVAHEQLRTQCAELLSHYGVVASVASREYNRLLRQSLRPGQQLETPLANVGLFHRMKRLKYAVRVRRELRTTSPP
jgi:hypothetical protein